MNNDKLALFTSLITLAVSVVAAFIFYGPDGTKGKRRKVAGLENLGNTCYLNTIIQSLAACKAFMRWLEQGHFEEHHQLAFLLSKLLKGVNNNEITVMLSPQTLLDALHGCNWWRGGQQDAHELFQFIISELAADQHHIASQISLFQPSLLHFQKDDIVYKLKSKFELQLMKISNRLEQPFRGSVANHLTCTLCKHKKPISLTMFDSLTLPMPSRTWSTTTLERLLHIFTQSELVQDVTCLKCSRKLSLGRKRMRDKEADNVPDVKTTFIKQMTISKVPQCLCIHIQRVSWQANGVPLRNDDYVKFPEILNVKTFCKANLCKKEINVQDKTIYKAIKKNRVRFIGSKLLASDRVHDRSLRFNHMEDKKWIAETETHRRSSVSHTHKLMAAIVHVGDAYSGHFLTYRRAPSVGDESSKDWLCISDASVRNATVSEMLQQKAYMLYYE